MKFSDRKRLSARAVRWCERERIPATPLNVVTFLVEHNRATQVASRQNQGMKVSFLTGRLKRRIRRDYRSPRSQARVKALWQRAHDAWRWLEDYRLPG